MPHWSSSIEYEIPVCYDPGRILLLGSQDTNLSCHMPSCTFCLQPA